MPVSNRLVTAEEFERIPDEPGVRMELVDGRIVRMSPPGYRHGEVATRILTLLIAHADRENLGRVVMPVGFRIASNPDSVREPDVAFISRQRLQETGTGDGFFQAAPDLAVEVRSPGDRRGAITSKIEQYLNRGVRMVWLINVRDETVTVYRPGVGSVTLSAGDTIDGADVLPGFECDVRRFFE